MSDIPLPDNSQVNPLTAGPNYIRFFIFYLYITYHILNAVKTNVTSISKIWKYLASILKSLHIFTHLKVVDRVS